MPKLIALVPTDLETSRLGLASMVGRQLCGQAVLAHTVSRLARIEPLEAVVLLHPPGQDPSALLAHLAPAKPIVCCVDPAGLSDRYTPMHRAARKWSLSSWRGGLGGATCYDELLPAASLLHAMTAQQADSALIVGGDWALVDPDLCRRVLELHLTNPEALQMTFCQAPPGLAGIVAGRALLAQFAEHHVGFGRILAYNPTRPQADPIGRDVCVQIDPAVRRCARRFIYDTKRSAALIDAVATRLGDGLLDADASAVTAAAEAVAAPAAETPAVRGTHDRPCQGANGWAALPRQVTLELTPRRPALGPIVPQYHVSIERPDMPLDLALRIVEQLGADGDTVLTLGGLGDALQYEHWRQVVTAAHEAGVLGICIETDLLEDQPVVEALLSVPIDVVSVRVNADTAATYQALMTSGTASRCDPRLPPAAAVDGNMATAGDAPPWFPGSASQTAPGSALGSAAGGPLESSGDNDRFRKVIDNVQHLLRARNRRWQSKDALADAAPDDQPPEVPPEVPAEGGGTALAGASPGVEGEHGRASRPWHGEGAFPGVPWVVPRLIKTTATLKDMETFFERWLTYSGPAVIEPATTGCGLMPDLAPLDMAPPRRFACRQLSRRMTIHSDGRVARCDQDWLASACAGDATRQALAAIWQALGPVRRAHDAGQGDELELCNRCREWHRP